MHELESVFISYRRDDSAGHAGRLSEHLCSVFGSDHVFMDVQDIAPGQDFAEAIERTITGCQAVIVVIGPRWAGELKTRSGQSDFVLHEVSVALRRSVTVIPVLVGGATMPSAAELPESIAALSRRQAVEIRDARFESDTTLLVDALRRLPGFTGATGRSRRGMWIWILAAAVLVIAAAGAFLKTRPPSFDITGVWIAEMAKPNQRSYRVRLDLAGAGGALTGTIALSDGRWSGSGRHAGEWPADVLHHPRTPVRIRTSDHPLERHRRRQRDSVHGRR